MDWITPTVPVPSLTTSSKYATRLFPAIWLLNSFNTSLSNFNSSAVLLSARTRTTATSTPGFPAILAPMASASRSSGPPMKNTATRHTTHSLLTESTCEIRAGARSTTTATLYSGLGGVADDTWRGEVLVVGSDDEGGSSVGSHLTNLVVHGGVGGYGGERVEVDDPIVPLLEVVEGVDDALGGAGFARAGLVELVGDEDGVGAACHLDEVDEADVDRGAFVGVEGLDEVDGGGDVLLVVHTGHEAKVRVGAKVHHRFRLVEGVASEGVVESPDYGRDGCRHGYHGDAEHHKRVLLNHFVLLHHLEQAQVHHALHIHHQPHLDGLSLPDSIAHGSNHGAQELAGTRQQYDQLHYRVAVGPHRESVGHEPVLHKVERHQQPRRDELQLLHHGRPEWRAGG
ncbi:Inositol 1,5-trisphosphate receptor type 3 [Striga asiatica]|uniref:Inositol 1,5-trisphosphate receptor type 3 n=1 Tax=Striga asiatica TaxID=4170 RepID=A0A5A7Q1C6_STRAF|nr:Inositol 1,5-trisphosphate receptor type 3 [Striga asiatica]